MPTHPGRFPELRPLSRREDITERHLASFRDVFAAIVNACIALLTGDWSFQQVKPEELQDASTHYADNITPRSIAPRWLITCNFDEIRIHDLDDERAAETFERIRLAELPDQVHRLSFLTRRENSRLEREKRLSVAAGEVVGRLYDALAKSYLRLETDPREQRSLNILITRVVFLLHAENAGLLHRPNAFYEYLAAFRAEQTATALHELFDALKTPEEQRDPYSSDALKQFPYINGGLFEQAVTIPQFTEQARDLLLREASAGFDWKDISPTIFGAVFESTLNPATRRAGAMSLSLGT